MADPEMDLDTAADLVESYRTRVVVPFDKLAEVIRLARDSKNLIAASRLEVPALEAQIAELTAARETAWRAAQSAKDAAATAQATAEADAQRAITEANQIKADAAHIYEQVRATLASQLDVMKAEHTTQRHALEADIEAARQRLITLQAEYEQLLANIRSKFGT